MARCLRGGVSLAWAMGLAMLAAAVLAGVMKPRPTPQALAQAQVPLETLFPASFAGWRPEPVSQALVRPATEAARRFQMYDQVLERVYVDGNGQQIMLSVAYGRQQSVRLQMHRPEVCYRAGGFGVSALQGHTLTLLNGRALPVTRLVASLSARVEPITYWRLLGDELVADDSQFLWTQVRLGVQRRLPDGLLVRVSSLDGDAAHAWAVQARFIADLAAALPPAARERVLGRGAAP